MKITILDTIPGEEDEIIIKCQNLSEDIQNLLQKLKQGNTKIAGHNENGIHLLEPDEVYYFETVDNKVFACCKKEVYEVREKLYTLEGMLLVESFMRASKSAILNLNKVKSLSPAFGGRFETVCACFKRTAWIIKEVRRDGREIKNVDGYFWQSHVWRIDSGSSFYFCFRGI